MIFPAFKAGDSTLRGSNGGFDSHTLPPTYRAKCWCFPIILIGGIELYQNCTADLRTVDQSGVVQGRTPLVDGCGVLRGFPVWFWEETVNESVPRDDYGGLDCQLMKSRATYLSTLTTPDIPALIRKRYSTVANKSHTIVTTKPRGRPSMNAPSRASSRGEGHQS